MSSMVLVRRGCAGVLVLWVLACGGVGRCAEAAGQWIVVTAPDLRPVLAPLIEHRQAEGFQVVVVETNEALSPEQVHQGEGTPLKERIKELVQRYQGRSCVLLAGIGRTAGVTNAENGPVPSLRGTIGRMKAAASDSGYGFPGKEGMPSIAVGRFPARTAEELRGMVQKTLGFEQDMQPAPWRNRLLLLLGNPGGGPLAEMYVQQNLDSHLASLNPAWEVRTLFNVGSSRYYLPRPRDRETALRYLQEGEMFSLYLGHSYGAGLGLDGKFMLCKDWASVSIPQGRGPFFTCGCYACQSSGAGDGYGLAAARNPAGPVAVIGAAAESYGAAGQLAVEGLMGCLRQAPFPTRLGDYWLAVQAGLARGSMDPTTFALLDMADGTQGKVPLATQRLEHLEMWMLLGDPALRLPVVPMDISVKVAEPIAAGKPVSVSGVLPSRLQGATVRLTLERPLDSEPLDLEKLPPNARTNRDVRERIFIANHQRANSFVLASAEAKTAGTAFTGVLQMPANLPWKSFVCRASATLSNDTALGVTGVLVKDAAGAKQDH
jgi:Peptidase family C25